MNAIRAAQGAARKAIEATYFGTLSVTEMKEVRDGESKLVKARPVVVMEGQPCRLSFETLKAAGKPDPAAAVTQEVKLFVSPEVQVRPGSKITVTQDGITADYTCSGVPAVYLSHQEIMLELFEGWC